MNLGFYFGKEVAQKIASNRNKNSPIDEEKQAMRELQNILASKNRKPCDCEAQVHELLENCLSCGRITCTAEGPGKCMYCENLILNEKQRARLQKYIDIQRPSSDVQSRRVSSSGPTTMIIDRQFDQFSIDNTKHLKAEDRRRLKENLDQLQEQKHQTKLLLHVDIENVEAGSQSAAKLDDFEGDLRRLQLNCQSIENEDSNLTLAELVVRESKTKHVFDYVEPVESHYRKQSTSKNNSTGKSAIKAQATGRQSKQKSTQGTEQTNTGKPQPKGNGPKGSTSSPQKASTDKLPRTKTTTKTYKSR